MGKKKKQLTPDSSVQDYIKLIKKQSACGEAVTWCEKFSRLTIREFYEHGLVDNTVTPGWVAWTLIVLGEQLSRELRIYLLENLSDKTEDPMLALHLYRTLPWLTDEDDALLISKFEGKLPTAEAELERGIIKREKDVGRNGL